MGSVRRFLIAATVAGACLFAGSAGAGEAAPSPPEPRPSASSGRAEPVEARRPTMYHHTLGGMFGRFSWQEHKRPWYEHVLWYFPSRGADLLDIIGIEAGWGWGAHANFHATRFAQLGIGRTRATWAGLMSRYPVMVDQEVDEKALLWLWRFDLSRKTLSGQTPEKLELSAADILPTYHKEVDPLGLGAAFFFGTVGLSFELKPHELLDLIKGFLTIDSVGDDY